jgi:ABC-type Fe3+/spermidine/putrescine transport system ATPase subunit
MTGTALRLEGLHVSHGTVPALLGLELDVGAGEVIALLGTSGSG